MIPFPTSKVPTRNEPCSCGSGRKFKQCCGAVIPIRAAPQPPPRASNAGVPDYTARAATESVHLGYLVSLDATRNCGTCTACCDGWLSGTVRGHEMKPGVPCHFRGAGCCTIHAERPTNPCRSFFCSWRLEGNPFPESFRPDRLGVMIVARVWRNKAAYELIAAGRDPDENLLNWMQELSTTFGIPFLYRINGISCAFGVPEFQEDMRAKAARGELPLLGDAGAPLLPRHNIRRR